MEAEKNSSDNGKAIKALPSLPPLPSSLMAMETYFSLKESIISLMVRSGPLL